MKQDRNNKYHIIVVDYLVVCDQYCRFPIYELEQKNSNRMLKMDKLYIYLTKKVLIPSKKFIFLNKKETVMVYNTGA